MRAIKEHIIQFQGLKEKLHRFEFELDNDFFEAVENEEIMGGSIHVDVDFDKRPSMMVAEIHATGHLSVLCDRCNEAMEQPIDGSLRQIFKVTEREEFSDEEVVALSQNDHELSLTTSIYECLVLSLPARKVHQESECDPEVVARLDEFNNKEEAGDPRWNALRGLARQ